MSTKRDYTGVASWQLSEVFQRHLGGRQIQAVSEQIPGGMSSRDLRKVVIDGAYAFTGLAVADRILLALGENISHLEATGEITIIPGTGIHAPRKMAVDEFWAKGVEPTPFQLTDRTNELAGLRDSLLK